MTLLEVKDLRVEFEVHDHPPLVAVRGVDLAIEAGEVLGLVGESGSGKSLTCRAVMGLVPRPGRLAGGSIRFEGAEVRDLKGRELRDFRAHSVGMISQNPFTSLNPVFKIGSQLTETLQVNRGMGRRAARDSALELLESVGIENPEKSFHSYPHELSGGMCQRVMIAIATASHPRLLLADEPTTALDVTTQAQILQLLERLKKENDMAILLVSHDFGVIAEACDRVAVMYGGHIVETGSVEAIYDAPEHPYTRALLASIPELDSAHNGQRRTPIQGYPPALDELIPGCVFEPRCQFSRESCKTASMDLVAVASQQSTACPVRPFAQPGLAQGDRESAEA